MRLSPPGDEPEKPAARKEHGAKQDGPEVDVPIVAEPAQAVFEQDEERGPGDRAKDAADTA
jgi:hypothetical protein